MKINSNYKDPREHHKMQVKEAEVKHPGAIITFENYLNSVVIMTEKKTKRKKNKMKKMITWKFQSMIIDQLSIFKI